MLVDKVMTSDVEACSASNTLAEAAALMWRRDCGSVPVVDEERQVIGILTDRDICMALATRGQLATEVTVGETMTAAPRTCTTADDIGEALEVMSKAQLRRLPVVDGAGRLAGILSLNDIIRHSDRGKSKKHVSHADAMATLKAVSAPHGGGKKKARAAAAADQPADRPADGDSGVTDYAGDGANDADQNKSDE